MAIIQASARIYRLSDDVLLGEGQCAIHVSQTPQSGSAHVSGTIVVEWAGEERLEIPDEGGHRLRLDDGRWLNVVFTKRTVAADGPEILRFRGAGPLRGPDSRE